MFTRIDTSPYLALGKPTCIFTTLAGISHHAPYHLHQTLQLEYHQQCKNIGYIIEQLVYLLLEHIFCQCYLKW